MRHHTRGHPSVKLVSSVVAPSAPPLTRPPRSCGTAARCPSTRDNLCSPSGTSISRPWPPLRNPISRSECPNGTSGSRRPCTIAIGRPGSHGLPPSRCRRPSSIRSARDRIGLAILRRTKPHALLHHGPARLRGKLRAHINSSVMSQAGAISTSASDSGCQRRSLDHRPPQQQQRDIAAHAGPDDDLRPLGQLLEYRPRLLAPAPDRAILEAAFRLAMTRIVEADERPALQSRPFCQRRSLGADHVRFEPLQPQHARRRPRLDEICDAAAGRARSDVNELRLALRHPIHALHCKRPEPLQDRRPTILQIIPRLDTGGAELSTIEITEAVVAAGGR